VKRLVVVILALLGVGLLWILPAEAQQYQSRLQQLVQKRGSLYLPLRLVLGQDNQFTVKANAGSKVMLYVSPADGGFVTPNGIALRVGEEHEKFFAEIPSNGVAQLTVQLPAEEDWENRELYVDAVVWQAEDYSDMEAMQLMDGSGRRTAHNALVMVKPAEKGGWAIMPNIPGVNAAALQQMEATSEALTNGDERKKELLDDGDINRDTLIDKNSLYQRPSLAPRPF